MPVPEKDEYSPGSAASSQNEMLIIDRNTAFRLGLTQSTVRFRYLGDGFNASLIGLSLTSAIIMLVSNETDITVMRKYGSSVQSQLKMEFYNALYEENIALAIFTKINSISSHRDAENGSWILRLDFTREAPEDLSRIIGKCIAQMKQEEAINVSSSPQYEAAIDVRGMRKPCRILEINDMNIIMKVNADTLRLSDMKMMLIVRCTVSGRIYEVFGRICNTVGNESLRGTVIATMEIDPSFQEPEFASRFMELQRLVGV